VKIDLPEGQAFVCIKTASIFLGVSEKGVYNMIRDGKLEAIRIGTRGLRISRISIESFIHKNRVDPVQLFA